MGLETEIAWCDSTWNPWWGCTRVDVACQHCYAEAFSKRTGRSIWGPGAGRRTFGEKHWREPIKWNRAAVETKKRHLVFCASMADVFDKDAPAGHLERLWDLIHATPALTWLLLTKRADRIARSLPADWGIGWPNVWLGVTVGDQAGLWRASALAEIPAVVRFLSVEPLLGPIDLGEALWTPRGPSRTIHWVIVGGESGAGCRPMDVEWARSIREQTHAADAAFFMKQMGGFPYKRDQLADLPEDLRIREFPMPF